MSIDCLFIIDKIIVVMLLSLAITAMLWLWDMNKNKIKGYGVCQKCHRPVEFRQSKAGNNYRSEQGSTQPHQCGQAMMNLEQEITELESQAKK